MEMGRHTPAIDSPGAANGAVVTWRGAHGRAFSRNRTVSCTAAIRLRDRWRTTGVGRRTAASVFGITDTYSAPQARRKNPARGARASDRVRPVAFERRRPAHAAAVEAARTPARFARREQSAGDPDFSRGDGHVMG